MPNVSITRYVLRIAIFLALSLAILWAVTTLWIDGPQSRILAGTLAGGEVLATTLAAILVRPWWRAALAIFICFAIVLIWWLSLSPRNDRQWQADVSQMPTATIEGSLLTVRNVRNFDYRSETDYFERWETRTYDLDALVGMDMFFSYWGPTHYGHTITSWEFADGNHIAISIETRKEIGEEYSAIRGFFRQFELYYVVADERDLVGLRTNHRGEQVELYRIIAPTEGIRDMLIDFVEKMNVLAEKPRWYNALTHNCTTTIWLHAKAVGSSFPGDWRLLANAHLVDLAYKRGLVNTSIPLNELKIRSDITALARSAAVDENFSKRIRQNLLPRYPDTSP